MRAFLLLLCISLLSLSWAAAGIPKNEKTADVSKLTLEPIGGAIDDYDSDGDDDDDSFFIEENPDFVPPEDDDDDDDDASDGDPEGDSSDSEDDGNEDDDAKSKLSKKLKKKKKQGPVQLLKNNKAKITIAVAVFAFRNELFKLVWTLVGYTFSEGGFTGILKLLLFVNFMRKMQTGGSGAGEERASLFHAVGSMIIKDNPAYLPPVQQHFCFESLNEYYVRDGMALQKAMRNKHEGLKWSSSSSSTLSLTSPFKKSKPTSNTTTTHDNGRTVVVLDWTQLDTQITSMQILRQEISFLLSEYRTMVMEGEATNAINSTTPPLEVVLLLESPGGSVPEYGLAGQHLLRLRNEPGITLTICVDKVAASGGYMLCCTASPGKLYASPFAFLGSIGVISQTVNARKLLTNWGIEPLEYRGGKYKAPIGLTGKITKDGKRVTQKMIDEIHVAFKQHIANARPVLKDTIDEIGNGSVWLGTNALELGLVDALMTSDEYIEQLIKDGSRVFKMLQAPRSMFLFGPPRPPGSSIDSKQSTMMEAENMVQESSKAFLRLPAQAKSLLKNSLQSFQSRATTF